MSDPEVIELSSDSEGEKKSKSKTEPPKAEVKDGKKRVKLITLKRKLGEESFIGRSTKEHTKFDRIKTTTDTSQNQQRRATLQPVQSSKKVGLSVRTLPMTSLSTKTRVQGADENAVFFLERSNSAPSSTVTSGEYEMTVTKAAPPSTMTSSQPLAMNPVASGLDLSKKSSIPTSAITSTTALNQPHNNYGKLSNDPKDQLAREKLIDWLKSVEESRKRVRDDDKLHELMKIANWGQHDRKKLEIEFDPGTPGKIIKGYYVLNSQKKRNKLSSHLKGNMKHTVSNTTMERKVEYRNRKHPVTINTRRTTAEYQDKAPPMDIMYDASLIPQQQMLPSLLETIKKLEAIPDGGGMQDYIGVTNGESGAYGMRKSHFSTQSTHPSPIYDATVGSDAPDVYCVEKKVNLVDCLFTRNQGEAFIMTYRKKVNEILGKNERYIITKTVELPANLFLKAQQYAIDGVPMYRFIKDGDRSHPPPFATIEEVTTFPYTISPSDLIIRFDPNNPTAKRHYTRYSTLEKLIADMGDPPDEYFVTADNSRDKFKQEFERIKEERKK